MCVAGNEPYELWKRFDKAAAAPAAGAEELEEDVRHGGGGSSSEYEAFKEERAACLWAAIEREIPDVRVASVCSPCRSP
jgi:hypothetical protein